MTNSIKRDLGRDEWRKAHRLLRLQYRRARRVLDRAAGDATTLGEMFRRVLSIHLTRPADWMHSSAPMVVRPPRAVGPSSRALFVSEGLWSESSREERRGIVAWALAIVAWEGSAHRQGAARQFDTLRDFFGATGAWLVVEGFIAARLLEVAS